MSKEDRALSLPRRLIAGFLALAIALSIVACATKPVLVWHQFSFDGWFDGWAKQVDLLEYSYGDQYRMVQDKVSSEKLRLRPQAGVNGPMPVGDFLYVKWRFKGTGEVLEDRVELRGLLPKDMTNHGLIFVIDGKQLYVYLRTPTPRSPKTRSGLKTYLADTQVTYEIYPTNTFKEKHP